LFNQLTMQSQKKQSMLCLTNIKSRKLVDKAEAREKRENESCTLL